METHTKKNKGEIEIIQGKEEYPGIKLKIGRLFCRSLTVSLSAQYFLKFQY